MMLSTIIAYGLVAFFGFISCWFGWSCYKNLKASEDTPVDYDEHKQFEDDATMDAYICVCAAVVALIIALFAGI